MHGTENVVCPIQCQECDLPTVDSVFAVMPRFREHMSQTPLHILAVAGSLNQASVTRTVITLAADQFRAHGCVVDALDFLTEPLPLFNPDSAHGHFGFASLKARVERADVFLLGTPDY